MINISILRDEDLQSVVKKFISALLPHDGFSSKQFNQVLQKLLKYIKVEEFEMEYAMLVGALDQFGKIGLVYEEFEIKLDKSTFLELVEVSIVDAVIRPEIGMKEWLTYMGMDSNLQNESVKNSACQTLYQRCEELYDECFEMGIATTEALNFEPELAQVFKQVVLVQALNSEAEILRGSLRVGRKTYSGVDDCLAYRALVSAEVHNRISAADSEFSITIDSIESSYQVLEQLKTGSEVIAEWGIPVLDDGTPILKHRLVIVVGNENVGKTQFAIDKAVNVLLQGRRVVYMCGESTKANIYCKILINYVWKKFGIIVRKQDVLCPMDCPTEVSKIINMSIIELASAGQLVLVEAFSYNSLGSELKAQYDSNHFDLVVIDHSCALKGAVGEGSLHSNVSELAKDVLEFKNGYPVCVLVTSHPSTHGKEALERGKEVNHSTTKGSNDLSANADEVFFLESNRALQKQQLIKLWNSKRRDEAVITEPIVLQTKFEVSGFIYDESHLAVSSEMTIDQQEALASLEADVEGTEFPY